MSDADNQLGGTGGESGPDPDEVDADRDNAAPAPDDPDTDSFPASDPPSNY